MKIERTYDTSTDTILTVFPWPEVPFGARVSARLIKQDIEATARRDLSGTVRINYDHHPVTVETARLWAAAILRACDIAEALQRGEAVVIGADEEMPHRPIKELENA